MNRFNFYSEIIGNVIPHASQLFQKVNRGIDEVCIRTASAVPARLEESYDEVDYVSQVHGICSG